MEKKTKSTLKENKNKHNKNQSKKKKLEKITENISLEKRKWNDTIKQGKKKEFKKGKITPEEEEKITNALCEYGFENDLSKEELLNIIIEKQTKDKKIWPRIAECLPNRSVQSIHNFCHRRYNPNNYKGNWSLKEEKILLNLVKEYGRKWEKIGKELERTATNCKDKYKNLGENHYNEIKDDINLSLILKFLKAIENDINDDINEKKYPIFNYAYKFKENVDNNYNVIFTLNKNNDKFLIDSSLKEEKSKVIIKNILKRLIKKDTLSSIIENKVEISWSQISSKIKFFSVDDCRNQWNQLLKNFEILEMEENKRDYKLIKKIYNSSFDNIDYFDFKTVHNNRKPDENKDKLEDLIRKHDLYGVKDFQTNIKEIYEELKNKIFNDVNDLKNDEEFENEIKRRKSNDIMKIYSEFLLKKRGRDD